MNYFFFSQMTKQDYCTSFQKVAVCGIVKFCINQVFKPSVILVKSFPTM